MSDKSWIPENDIKPYLFFSAFFFGPKQNEDLWFEKSIEKLSALISGGLIDLGCGTGTVTFCFGKYLDNVVGIDSSPTMIRVANYRKTTEMLNNVSFMEADMMQINVFEAEAAFTSSLGHLLGDELKLQFFQQADKNQYLKRIFVYSPIIKKNYDKTIEGKLMIKGVPCHYFIASHTDFNVCRHYADYRFEYQNKEYKFSYCFDYINYIKMHELLDSTNWYMKEVLTNPNTRSEYLKNFETEEIIYVIEKK